MRTQWMALTLLTAAVLSCGDDSKSKPVERGDFDVALARAMCERYARCGLVEDLEHCEKRERTTGFTKQHGLGTRYDLALEDGRVRYDAQAAGACVAFLGNLGCQDVQAPYVAVLRGIEYASECRFLHGTLADGASCQRSTECQDGSYCDASSFSCGGVCRRGPPPEPVATADACPPDTVIIGQRCRAPSQAGGPCGPSASGGLDVGLCEYGLRCDWETGTCLAPRKEGEACGFILEGCVWSLSCRDGRCQKRLDEGASCTAGTILRRECRTELFCDADDDQAGTCRPRLAAGETCRHGSECGDHLYCASVNPAGGTPGTCQPMGPLGAPCHQGVQCDHGLICSHTSFTCQPSSRPTERCTESGACEYFSACVDGVCQEPGLSPCP